MGLGTTVVKRSVTIDGHKTSVSLEDAFWEGLKKIAEEQRSGVSKMVEKINSSRDHGNLCSAIRVYVLRHFQESNPADQAD